MLRLFFSLFILTMIGCSYDESPKELNSESNMSIESAQKRTYLALGDSYTIGESVEASKRWPNQYKEKIIEAGIPMDSVYFIATTGWTTDELMAGMDEADIDQKQFDLVSLSIGVNNQYRGRDTAEYRAQLKELIERALGLAGGQKDAVFLVNIPDWGVTPFAQKMDRDSEKVAEEIQQFNSIMAQEAEQYGLYLEDIYEVSRQAKVQESYVAEDGLHPSAEMYAKWVEQLQKNHLERLVAYFNRIN